MWNELVEGGVKGERASFQMKQSTDDLAKFKPSQTLTLNIALGSGSIAGASEGASANIASDAHCG